MLANVPAAALPSGTMEALPIYIRDLGKGLLMTGGENAFGAGGYLRTPLETAMPGYMDVKSRALADNLALIVAERERLARRLAELPYLRPYPSVSNFILCRVVGRDAAELKRALEQAGILVRYFDKPGLRDHVRITVGRPEQSDALLAALRSV